MIVELFLCVFAVCSFFVSSKNMSRLIYILKICSARVFRRHCWNRNGPLRKFAANLTELSEYLLPHNTKSNAAVTRYYLISCSNFGF